MKVQLDQNVRITWKQ